MEIASFVESIRRLNRARPFHQYEIARTDGELIRVAHPDSMAYNGKFAVVLTPDGLAHHLNHEQVSTILPTDEPPAPGGLGDIPGRFYSEDRHVPLDEILKQITVVAGDLDDLALPSDAEPFGDVVDIPPSMIEP